MQRGFDWKYELLLLLSVAVVVATLGLAPAFVAYTNNVRPWIDDQEPSFAVALVIQWGARPAAVIVSALYLTRIIMLTVRVLVNH